MSSWASRAKLHFSQKAQGGTDETDETHLHSTQKAQIGTDETDKTPITSVLSVHVGPLCAKRESANDAASTTPQGSPDGLRVVSPALDAVLSMAADMAAADPDRWCWPESDAMNTAEIDRFMARVALFGRQGLALAQAQDIADRLVGRDRDGDDRRMCRECSNLSGASCNNWVRAGVAIHRRDARMPGELLHLLQHCPGFKAAGGSPWA